MRNSTFLGSILCANLVLIVSMAIGEPQTPTATQNVPLLVLPSTNNTDPVLAFAAEELARCLTGKNPPTNLNISLQVDAALGHAHELRRDGDRLQLAGGSPTAVLHAVFTMLECLGWRFDVSFPVVPETPRWSALPSGTKRITPAIPRRGIRQHLNFPMDLSAWPLTDVNEYVRNLARLRFTHLAVHSYPNQWVAYRQGEKEQYAGNFFYGEKHPVTGPDWFRKRVGQQIWCIPEVESLMSNKVARSAFARDWLKNLIIEAKRVGLTVTFSFEPRRTDAALTNTLAQAEAILTDYPNIDRLELMIEEGGEENAILTSPKVVNVDPSHLESLIGPTTLANPEVALMMKNGKGLKAAAQTAHNLLVLAELKRRFGSRVGLDLGLYNTAPRVTKGLIGLWRASASSDVGLALLSAHGASRVAHCFPNLGLRPEEYARTMIYSWVEFDGLMYLQQDACEGLSDLMNQILVKDVVPPGLAVNHWRVAENALGLRYCAELCLAGRLSPNDFRSATAVSLGISEPDRVRQAMATLARLTVEMHSNVGFCYYNCWQPPLDPQMTVKAKKYADIREMLAPCKSTSQAGTAWLSLMRNRLEASDRYLRALGGYASVKECLGRKGESLPGKRDEALRICDQALKDIEAMMALMIEETPDRASLGNLVSIERVVQRRFHEQRDRIAGTPAQVPASEAKKAGGDAPPPPKDENP